MPNSKADAAKGATIAGEPAADAKSRARAGRRASADHPAPMSGIIITRWSLGISLSLAVAILGGAHMLQWDRTTRVEAEVRDLRAELHTEINGLRRELRADIRAEIGVLRDEVRELAALLRARDDTGAE